MNTRQPPVRVSDEQHSEPRSPEQLVAAGNELARRFLAMQGYEVPEGHRFDISDHPREVSVWNLAVIAYDHIVAEDLEDAAMVLEV
jgi:hypothetical protein